MASYCLEQLVIYIIFAVSTVVNLNILAKTSVAQPFGHHLCVLANEKRD